MERHWDDLRVFLAVARTQSLSGAGKLLRIDPATVGRRIARLERDMSATFFAKSPQGYALSEAGLRLLERAGDAEVAMRAASEALQGQSDKLTGQIRLGAPDGSANFLLPRVCSEIADENPDLDIQIVALPRVFNLSKREADMAVAVSAPTAGRLMVQKLSDYKLHMAASEDYLAGHPPIHHPDDLKNHRMVGYIQDMIFDKELDYLSDLGIEKVALASNSVSVQINWIRQGAGVGIVHDFAMPAMPGLQKILTDHISLTRGFYLIRHEDDRGSDRLSRFADRLAAGVRLEVARLEGLT